MIILALIMLIACVRALFETDFKIIALSILNQLGIIFLSLGLGNCFFTQPPMHFTRGSFTNLSTERGIILDVQIATVL